MSSRRDATVEALREALIRSDLSLVERLLADDVRWYGNFPGGACHNRDQVLATLHGALEGGVRPQLVATRTEGDRVLLQVALAGNTESADPVPRLWLALTVDDAGRITELQDYSTEATAGRDASLRTRGTATDDRSPASPVTGLVPFAHVADVERSVAFFELLGLELRETYEHEGRVVWASMGHASAALMLAEGEAPIDARAQGVLFYLYAEDLPGLRDHLVAQGVTVGEIVDGSPGPKREMRVTDPDGYCLMVAQIDDATISA
jgi:catechol 2,3-dioxygenase-like lactoylglutathione lyase family enzyme